MRATIDISAAEAFDGRLRRIATARSPLITVFLLTDDSRRADALRADLARVGIHSLGAGARDELVRVALEKAPDPVLVDEVLPEPPAPATP